MSDEKQETIADIVAFIRKCLDLLDNELSRKSNGELSLSAEALLCPVLNAKAALDRIEEAWEREKAEVEASALAAGGMVEASRHKQGNAAAMREAAETALTIIRGVINGTIARTNNSVFDCRDKLKSALAAPARNLERFRDWDEAEAEYLRLVAEGKVEDGTWCEWLFSTGPYAECRAMYGAEHEGNAEGETE